MESVLDYIGKAHVIIYSICWYILASLNSVYEVHVRFFLHLIVK